MMETSIFPHPAVAEVLESFVEARLHTDGRINIDRIREVRAELVGHETTPTYVLLDPVSGKTLAILDHATFDEDDFVDFLRKGLPGRT